MGTTPSSFASLSQILTAVGGVTEAVSSVLGTKQARGVAEANAAIARRNAQVQANALEVEALQSDYAATIARQEGSVAAMAAAFQVRQTRKARRRQESENLAAIGRSGVAVEGSPLESLVEDAREAETESLLLQQRGLYAQAAREREAQLLQYQGRVQRYQADQVRRSGAFAAQVTQYNAPSYSSALLKGLGTLGRTAASLSRPTKQPLTTGYSGDGID